jgi:hypothetical protein
MTSRKAQLASLADVLGKLSQVLRAQQETSRVIDVTDE